VEWLFLVAGLLIGYVLGKWRRDEPFNQDEPIRIQAANTTLYLYSLDRDRLAALAERLNTRPNSFRFAQLVGPKKLMSRSEWVRVRKEMVDRGLMEKARNRTMRPTPLGAEFFKTYTTTRAHMHKHKIPGYFDR